MPVLPNGASQSVIDGGKVYRITRELQSSGDIFEIDTSVLAMYVGPESDVAEIRAEYFDKRLANQTGMFTVSPNGPWVESLLSNPVARTVGGLPGVIRVYPANIVKPDYERPAASPTIPDRRFQLPTIFDLNCALSPSQIGSIPAVRSDKTFRVTVPYSPNGGPPNDGSTDLVIPIYGRRFVSITIEAAAGFVASFFVVTLQPGVNTEARLLGSLTRATLSINIVDSVVLKLTNDLSDYGGGGGVLPAFAAGPIGLSDLLVINIAENGLTPLPGDPGFADLIVEVSDRVEG